MGAALEGLISAQLLQTNQYNCVLSLSVALDDHNTPPSTQDTLQDKSLIVEDSLDSVEQNKTISASSHRPLSGYEERGRKPYKRAVLVHDLYFTTTKKSIIFISFLIQTLYSL